MKSLSLIKKDCLRETLKLYKEANAGHIGTSLSCLDILVYLYFKFMESNDRFILSKGHAALGFYVVLAKKGLIDPELLNKFYINGTSLAAHPPCNKFLKAIPFGTGSLGHGLSLAAGFALSDRFKRTDRRVFCLLSDGDCNEGSTWEAALFAAQQNLKNLYVIIDNNQLQGFGRTSDIINLDPLAEKWISFNFDVVTASNGNDFNSIDSAFKIISKKASSKPKCIIARTTKGHGVSFMENRMEWHYLPLTEELYLKALSELK